MLPYDSTTLNGFSAAMPVQYLLTPAPKLVSAVATTYIGTDFIELAGRRFNTKQLAYLLVKLLEEHPECQV